MSVELIRPYITTQRVSYTHRGKMGWHIEHTIHGPFKCDKTTDATTAHTTKKRWTEELKKQYTNATFIDIEA